MEATLKPQTRKLLFAGLYLVWIIAAIHTSITKGAGDGIGVIIVTCILSFIVGFTLWAITEASRTKVVVTYEQKIDAQTRQPLSGWRETDRGLRQDPSPSLPLKTFVKNTLFVFVCVHDVFFLLRVFFKYPKPL